MQFVLHLNVKFNFLSGLNMSIHFWGFRLTFGDIKLVIVEEVVSFPVSHKENSVSVRSS